MIKSYETQTQREGSCAYVWEKGFIPLIYEEGADYDSACQNHFWAF